jgi:hypothetical protein
MAQGIETIQSPANQNPAEQYPQEAVQQFGQALSSLSEEEIEALRDLADDLREMSPEELTALKQVIDFLIRRQDQYDAAVQTVIRQGLVEPGDLPPDFDPVFFDILSRMVDDAMSGEEPQQFAAGGIASLKKKSRRVAKAGRKGDTMLAHLSPSSAETLRSMGGSGTTNPQTGLKEYFLGGVFKSIGGFLKKAAGVVLPIALNFAFPGLGTIASGAIGAGLGALINGASPGQALTAGLVGGVGGALYGGVSSMLGGGSFMQGVTGGLPSGMQSMFSSPTAGAPAVAPSTGISSVTGMRSEAAMAGAPSSTAAATPGMLDTARNWISANPLTAAGIAGLGGVALASAMQPEQKAGKIEERNVEGTRFAPGTFQVYQAPRVNVVPTYSPAYAATGGEIDARRGGHLKGPGTGTSDSIPARLSDGEFVMTAAAVRGAGNGSREKGAKRMYDMMHKFEKRA